MCGIRPAKVCQAKAADALSAATEQRVTTSSSRSAFSMTMDGVRASIEHAQGSNLPLAAGRSHITFVMRFMTERRRAACKACGEQLYQQRIAAPLLVEVGSRAEARKQQKKPAQGCKERSDRRCVRRPRLQRGRVRLCLLPWMYTSRSRRQWGWGAAPSTYTP